MGGLFCLTVASRCLVRTAVRQTACSLQRGACAEACKVKASAAMMKSRMAVTTEVETGKRRIIEVFLASLLQEKKEALRER